MKVQVNRDDIDRMLDALRDMKAGNPLERRADDAHIYLIAFGFVERNEVHKPCPTCGTPKFDYAYFRITPAGEAILVLADGPPSPPTTTEEQHHGQPAQP